MREHLLAHFRFEEQNGYMDAIRRREPRLERAIQELLEEHRVLKDQLDELIAATQTGKDQDAALPDGVHKWIQHLRRHEAAENRLMEEAYTQDIGSED
jgi:hypothetical protein